MIPKRSVRLKYCFAMKLFLVLLFCGLGYARFSRDFDAKELERAALLLGQYLYVLEEFGADEHGDEFVRNATRNLCFCPLTPASTGLSRSFTGVSDMTIHKIKPTTEAHEDSNVQVEAVNLEKTQAPAVDIQQSSQGIKAHPIDHEAQMQTYHASLRASQKMMHTLLSQKSPEHSYASHPMHGFLPPPMTMSSAHMHPLIAQEPALHPVSTTHSISPVQSQCNAMKAALHHDLLQTALHHDAIKAALHKDAVLAALQTAALQHEVMQTTLHRDAIKAAFHQNAMQLALQSAALQRDAMQTALHKGAMQAARQSAAFQHVQPALQTSQLHLPFDRHPIGNIASFIPNVMQSALAMTMHPLHSELHEPHRAHMTHMLPIAMHHNGK